MLGGLALLAGDESEALLAGPARNATRRPFPKRSEEDSPEGVLPEGSIVSQQVS